MLCALLAGACGGKKKAAGGAGPKGPGKPDAPVTWAVGPLGGLGLTADLPSHLGAKPLGDGKTQVDVSDDGVIINVFKRPGRADLALLQTPPAGSAEEKLEWHEKLPGGAIWLIAHAPPGGGEPFGWTLTAKWSGLIEGDFEIECYALLSSPAARKKYEATVKRVCTSLAALPAGDGGSASAGGDAGAK